MNNSELLFLYDAQLANPNGDPDDENRPRMDYQSRRNLVSDVRLKRYIRDYLQDAGHELYVAQPRQGEVVTADKRLQTVLGGKKPTVKDLPEILDQLMDIRLFGATMPIKGEGGGAGSSIQVTGPVQFTWGYSLNHVDLVNSYTISSRFSSQDEKNQGTFGKDYRVYYSLLTFAGVVSGKRAEISRLTESDLAWLDQALVEAIPLQTTRSKIGQFPRLYMRVEYVDDRTVLGDWRELLDLDEKENLRSTADVRLRVDRLVARITEARARIAAVHLWQHPDFRVWYGAESVRLADVIDSAAAGLVVPVETGLKAGSQ
ncbi:type I-B CRISPR-associated protein Cas7/Csh2 [Alicyclobacillus cycloheptanicus]|uniref:CRISPR-associated protein Csh2 n=1 Tax=Alicyclobacillus cycloheptanicus TaxID=1457 RepID=A0ABT9XLW3_9BACL|nr:type I-B CRISPR-associated protein Cas7/Csh2 [Alicyclobacillus cycloheptanicus]MDQ0191303.1 CRISPR-associated protein Csh2 [Alicyclobacillus cycloheptanicus]WDM02420.1 type I-B CRISPR-associated protein Cas7/Csh2 [Alicyclobacillus cycloheptanicus]